MNFTLVAGSEALYVRLLPWLLVAVVGGGLIYAQVLKARKPEVYAGLSPISSVWTLSSSPRPRSRRQSRLA